MAAQGGTKEVVVYVVAEKGTDLSDVATVQETRPYMDAQLMVLKVKPTMLGKVASDPA